MRLVRTLFSTNTFNSNSISQEDYQLEERCYELNFEGARLAKNLCEEFTASNPEKPRVVAGALGPTNRTLSISPDVNDPGFRALTFDALKAVYKDQLRGLIDGGSDIVLIETIFDTLNAKAAIMAVDEYTEEHGLTLPVMISGTITDQSGRTLSGQTTPSVLDLS